ncbi:MAG: hypothetical protein CSA62_05805 [Planctomycetota bacterium]|nr:MAG: hypothetical protein CSA62_05805 [Planctomycetota bacterium]
MSDPFESPLVLPPTRLFEDERGWVCWHWLRVRYAETDQMGVAHHGAYVLWVEEARSEWIRHQGRSYADLEKKGLFLAVVDMGFRFKRSAQYDNLIRIETWLTERRKASLVMAYKLFADQAGDGGGLLLADAHTKLGLLDDEMRPCALPVGLF